MKEIFIKQWQSIQSWDNIRQTLQTPYRSDRHSSPKSKVIRDLLAQGIVLRSESCYLSSVVLVYKNDNSSRLCLDARVINKRICPGYEMPTTIDVLLSKCNCALYSKLDLKAAFYLLPLTESSKQYCAFSINGSVYHFNVCPFGIKDSPSAFLRFLHKILNHYNQQPLFWWYSDLFTKWKRTFKPRTNYFRNLEACRYEN